MEFFHRFKTVLARNRHLPPGLQLRDIGGQGFAIGGVQFKQLQFVAPAQWLLADKGRTWINLPLARRIKPCDHV